MHNSSRLITWTLTIALLGITTGCSQKQVTDSQPSAQNQTSEVEYSAPPAQSEVSTNCSNGVCTRAYTAQNGDTSIYSTGYGHSYDVHTRTYKSDDKTTVKSWDSEGNSYSVESHCDSTGCHSSDSQGNSCSILSDGTIVGCK